MSTYWKYVKTYGVPPRRQVVAIKLKDRRTNERISVTGKFVMKGTDTYWSVYVLDEGFVPLLLELAERYEVLAWAWLPIGNRRAEK